MFQIGQEVAVRSGAGAYTYRVATIASVGANQIRLTTGQRFDLNGYAVKNSTERLLPMTDAIREHIYVSTLADRLAAIHWSALSVVTLESVIAALGETP